ncbi:MAG TPA: MerR family transcriptional regulator [Blastocatellia bacterium]|nr:MerR family transcriptional regulator [Blastocatellia bacterium]
MKELKELRERKYIGTAQLADEAARLVLRFVPRQERQSVSPVPDERTVRYYTTEGLLSPPEGKQGLNAVYGYQHLLQLLVIKRLQAEHLPIRKIKELVEGKSARELEQLLDLDEPPASSAGARIAPRNAATEYLESLLTQSAARRIAAPPATAEAFVPAASPSAWSRVEVEPGLELHIREDYRLSTDSKERQRLARRLMSELEQHGTEPGK